MSDRTKPCTASPCDIIAAINQERDRICQIILLSSISEGAKSAMFDSIHGVLPDQSSDTKQTEGK